MAKKILIIEDEKILVQLLASGLQHDGYQVGAAFDANQGTMSVIREKPDLVLLDIMMPAGSGLDVLNKLRANTKTSTIPVIVMTARSDNETKEAAEKLGISGYFVKGGDSAELMAKIKEVPGG